MIQRDKIYCLNKACPERDSRHRPVCMSQVLMVYGSNQMLQLKPKIERKKRASKQSMNPQKQVNPYINFIFLSFFPPKKNYSEDDHPSAQTPLMNSIPTYLQHHFTLHNQSIFNNKPYCKSTTKSLTNLKGAWTDQANGFSQISFKLTKMA